MMMRSDNSDRVLSCSLCLKNYIDHNDSDEMCIKCFEDTLTFKDLEDTYVYPTEGNE